MTDQEQPDLGGELAADQAAAHPSRVVLDITAGEAEVGQFIEKWIKNYVRLKGGGDVQRAFGFVRPQMAAEREQPAEIKVSGGVRLPSLGGGNRG